LKPVDYEPGPDGAMRRRQYLDDLASVQEAHRLGAISAEQLAGGGG
jgi:hypothetical protein